MAPWTSSLSVGIREIDDQHADLLERVEALDAATRARAPGYRLQELLEFLRRYAEEHFRAEERLMREVEYPGLADHLREHEKFRQRLEALRPHWESEGSSAAMVMATSGFLDAWLADHVRSSDQLVARHVREMGRRRRVRRSAGGPSAGGPSAGEGPAPKLDD
jgi:hemerythrin